MHHSPCNARCRDLSRTFQGDFWGTSEAQVLACDFLQWIFALIRQSGRFTLAAASSRTSLLPPPTISAGYAHLVDNHPAEAAEKVGSLMSLPFLGVATLLILACIPGHSQSNDSTISAIQPIRSLGHRPHHADGGFRNFPPTPEDPFPGVGFILRRLRTILLPGSVPPGHSLSEDEALARYRALKGRNTITWLGHATFLIRINGVTILTDPFLTRRAGIIPRSVPPGIAVERLPEIDVIIVSHNHYDHLDASTVEALSNKERIKVFVPLALGAFFTERGYRKVTELDWGDDARHSRIRFTALPAVHGSGRGFTDENKTLWASWAIESSTLRFYFAGDTGYSPTLFKEIGRRFGHFNAAFLPIGGYAPRESQAILHATPAEAVTIGQEVGASILIAMHWGTIELSDEPFAEPVQRFRRAAEKAGFSKQTAWVMRIGETRVFPVSSN